MFRTARSNAGGVVDFLAICQESGHAASKRRDRLFFGA
jgi:hypothetical protein